MTVVGRAEPPRNVTVCGSSQLDLKLTVAPVGTVSVAGPYWFTE